ncbi:MAG TPA: hypothetical protein VKB38_19075, partial [Terracidiphilus sp.]|nr:hypothetical protein [Terracidiphilus sp.]
TAGTEGQRDKGDRRGWGQRDLGGEQIEEPWANDALGIAFGWASGPVIGDKPAGFPSCEMVFTALVVRNDYKCSLRNGEYPEKILRTRIAARQRPDTFAQTNPLSSLFACDKAADHTFRVGGNTLGMLILSEPFKIAVANPEYAKLRRIERYPNILLWLPQSRCD